MSFTHALYHRDAALSHICFGDTENLAVCLISSKKLLISFHIDVGNNQMVTNMGKLGNNSRHLLTFQLHNYRYADMA